MSHYTLLTGHVLEMLRTLPSNSVQCVVTSPPYFSLRKYGDDSRELGQERSPQEFVANLVQVFDEVRRVLRPDGTLWVNIADSYAGSWGNYSGQNRGAGQQRPITNGSQAARRNDAETETWRPATSCPGNGLKRKDRCAVPERFVIAMQDAGWWYRDNIVWAKPNPMPASLTDRTTPAHEPVFMFTKSARYYYDHIAIREPIKPNSVKRLGQDVESQAGGARANGGTRADRPMKPVVAFARPQHARAIELALEAGLTEDHIDAIGAVGFGDTGRGAETQNGRNAPETLALFEEAREALGGYSREFASPALRNTFARVVRTPDGQRPSHRPDREPVDYGNAGANKRSVWTVPTGSFDEAHFATMPPALVEPMVLAGTSARGACPTCGAPFRRVIERGFSAHDGGTESAYEAGSNANRIALLRQAARERGVEYVNDATTVGWYPTCHCAGLSALPKDDGAERAEMLAAAADLTTAPCVVLDPFNGAATVGVVALALGRDYIGIDLYPKYIEMSERRLSAVQPGLHGLGI